MLSVLERASAAALPCKDGAAALSQPLASSLQPPTLSAIEGRRRASNQAWASRGAIRTGVKKQSDKPSQVAAALKRGGSCNRSRRTRFVPRRRTPSVRPARGCKGPHSSSSAAPEANQTSRPHQGSASGCEREKLKLPPAALLQGVGQYSQGGCIQHRRWR